MKLKAALLQIDVKNGATLEKVFQSLPVEAALLRQLIEWGGHDNEALQSNATWLLKRHAEQGGAFTSGQQRKLCNLLGLVTAWPAALHVLQTIARINIPAEQAQEVFEQALGWVQSDNKFVRAWSYNALAVLGEQHPDFRPKVQTQLIAARFDPAASVKARVRIIVKDHAWLAG